VVALLQYVAGMAKDGEWGGQIEISAVSRLYGIDVVIYQHDAPAYEMRVTPKASKRKIFLYYQTECHYVSVRPKGTRDFADLAALHVSPVVSKCAPESKLNETSKSVAHKSASKAKEADTIGNGDVKHGTEADEAKSTNKNVEKENIEIEGDEHEHEHEHDDAVDDESHDSSEDGDTTSSSCRNPENAANRVTQHETKGNVFADSKREKLNTNRKLSNRERKELKKKDRKAAKANRDVKPKAISNDDRQGEFEKRDNRDCSELGQVILV
jgi:hypothetical protein